MKTQDIRNMALALQAVEEASKKKLDPVGKATADIDNDGDTDKSDSYLHNRRKAVSSAIKGKGTKETVTMEEVEQVDEISTELATKVMKQRKSQGDAFRNKAGIMSGSASDSAMANAKKNWNKADKIASIVKKRAANEEVEDFMMSEEVELEESTVGHGKYTITTGPKKTGAGEGSPSHVVAKRAKMAKLGVPHHDDPGEYGHTVKVTVKNNETGDVSHHHVYQRDTDKGSKEALVSTRSVGTPTPSHKAHEKVLHNYLSGKKVSSLKEETDLSDFSIEELKDFMMSEDFDQLDEISKKTLGSYVKAAVSDTAFKTSEKDTIDRDYPKASFKDRLDAKTELRRAINKRRTGISQAVNRLTKEETSWPIFARIQEKVNQTKGATKPESMEDVFTASDKKMVAGHGGIGKKTPLDIVDDHGIDVQPKPTNVKVAPKRHNDQTVGDKSIIKSK